MARLLLLALGKRQALRKTSGMLRDLFLYFIYITLM